MTAIIIIVGVVFALDPDGYWIDIVSRSAASAVGTALLYTLAQTLLHVWNPAQALALFAGHDAIAGEASRRLLSVLPRTSRGE
jgi:hypothetical protein